MTATERAMLARIVKLEAEVNKLHRELVLLNHTIAKLKAGGRP